MKRPALYLTSFVLLFGASIAALSLSAAVDSPRSLMSPADYAQEKRAIEATTREALARCSAVTTGRDVCRAEARADERVQRAHLTARYLGTVAAAADIHPVRVKARFDVARARCEAAGIAGRSACMQDARNERDRLLAQAAPSNT